MCLKIAFKFFYLCEKVIIKLRKLSAKKPRWWSHRKT